MFISFHYFMCILCYFKIITFLVPMVFGPCTNAGLCKGMEGNPACGTGEKDQTRTCTDGTIEKCDADANKRTLTCALQACRKY